MARFDLRLRLKVENIRELSKKIRESVERAFEEIRYSDSFEGIGESILNEIRDKKQKIEDELKRISVESKKELASKLVDELVSKKEELEPEKLVGAVRPMRKEEEKGGVLGGLASVLGRESPLLLGIFALVSLISTVVGLLGQLVQAGATFSGYGQAMLKVLKLIFELALKPIADVIGYIMLPILLALLKYVIIPWSKITDNIRKMKENVGDIKKKIYDYFGVGGKESKEAFETRVEGESVGNPFLAGLDKFLHWILEKYKNFDKYMKSKHFAELSFGGDIGKIFKLLESKIKEKIPKIVSGISSAFAVVKNVLWQKMESGVKMIGGVWDRIKVGLGLTLESGVSKVKVVIDNIKRSWVNIKNKISSIVFGEGSPVSVIVDSWKNIQKDIKSLYSGGSSPLENIIDGWKNIQKDIKSLYSGGRSPLESIISGWNVIKSMIKSLFSGDGAVTYICSYFGRIGDMIGGLLRRGGVIESIVMTFVDIADAIKSAYNRVKSILKDWIHQAEEAARNAWNAVTGAVSSVASSVTYYAGYGVTVTATTYQSGGYVPKSGLYYLHSGEYVIPVKDLKVGRSVNNYNVNLTINASVRRDDDIKRIADEVERILTDKMYRRGAFR